MFSFSFYMKQVDTLLYIENDNTSESEHCTQALML